MGIWHGQNLLLYTVLLTFKYFLCRRKKQRRIRGTRCSSGSPSSSIKCVERVSTRGSLAQLSPFFSAESVILTQFLFTCSLRAWSLLHRYRHLRRKHAVPRYGHGSAWPVSRRSLPVLQAQLRLKNRADDRHPARPPHREGPRGAHYPS